MKTFYRSFIALTLATGLSLPVAFGAQDYDKPWDGLKLDSKKKVKFDFHNATVDNVIRFFSKITGITIVADPTLTGSLNLSTPNEVKLTEALSILSSSLDLKGFTVQREGNYLIVKAKPKQTAGRQGGFPGGNANGGTNPFGGGTTGGATSTRTTSELRTYTLKYASATNVAKAINDAFSQSSSTNFGGFNGGNGGPGNFGGPGGGGPGGGGPGGPGGGGTNLLLTYTVLEPQGPGGGGPGGFGGGQGGFGRGGGQGFPGAGGGNQSNTNSNSLVKASAEEYSNTVMVYAPVALQVQVSEFIKKIDVEIKQVLTTRLYPLTYCAAADLVSSIQSVLTANATKGRGSTTTQTTGFFPFGNNNNNSSSTTGTVSAESRSNSLIVTTTEQNHTIVAGLIERIDKEITSTDANAVVPLANAKATDIATLLNQAFGTRSGSRTATSTGTTSRTSSTSTTNRNTTNTGGGGLGGQLDPSSVYAQTKDPNADSGELAMNVAVQQGFGGFGQQQNSGASRTSSTSSSSEVSRDAQGKIINTTDLTGRVTIVADSNTNSLIIIGDPDAVARVKTILDQLDKIPQQVVIETMIVEASLDAESKLGVEWSLKQPKAFGTTGSTGTVGSNYGLQPTSGTSSGFSYTLSGGNFSAFLNALKTDQKFQVLSTPRIFTSNNVEATINISQSVPYVTSQRTDTSGAIIFNYAFQDVGIVLTVTPQISPSGNVTMAITQTANELQGYTSFNAPIVNQREATTTVSVEDGNTIVLGGIMRKTVSTTNKKVPILGDLPLLGNLFKSTDKTDSKTELLVFLTPRVVRSTKDAAADTERQKKQLSPEAQKTMGKG